MAELPTGTVTFLFSDLEVSTRLWEQYREAMVEARARYFTIVDEAVDACGRCGLLAHGRRCRGRVRLGPRCSPRCRRGAIRDGRGVLGGNGPLAARMALHTGEGIVVGEDQYDSQPLNRCPRV